MNLSRCVSVVVVVVCGSLQVANSSAANGPQNALPPVVRSAGSGAWSAVGTWEGGRVPGTGDRVLIRPGHRVVYDVDSPEVIRGIHLAGALTFDPGKKTRLDVGLIRIEDRDEYSETGFDCSLHVAEPDPSKPRAALEVGTPNRPIDARYTALIRLVYQEGMDKESCPAIVCCGGRMDFHGAPLSRTWVKLGANVAQGETTVVLAETVEGWRVGDRIIVTTSKRFPGSTPRDYGSGIGCASEKTIVAIDGAKITLDAPIEEERQGTGDFRAEAANLSRNVIVESGDPQGVRGHTMYHRNSAGAISYAEFRHLGKPGVLGRYSLHYHLVGDTMRGSYVLGASIWDSGNRWLTIHGTNYLVVRDCVGYQSLGHGFYLEDGTEVFNVLDRNLAVQAYKTKPLPNQALPFDRNEAAGFWWANNLNTFTRNVGVGNERYAFRYEMLKTAGFDPVLPVQQADGSLRKVDVRTLPFVRFDDNEAHNGRFYGVNIGEGTGRVGPDHAHPLVVRNLKIWHEHYAFRPDVPSMVIENLRLHHTTYGFYHPNYDHHVYRNVHASGLGGFVFKRSGDAGGTPDGKKDHDFSAQYGPLTVDGLTLDNCGSYSDNPAVRAVIGLADYNPTGQGVSHYRNVQIVNFTGSKHRILVDRGPWPSAPERDNELVVPVYFHDYYGPGRHAKIANTAAKDFAADGLAYREESPLTGRQSRVAEVSGIEFPEVLKPVDDLPPTTVATHALRKTDGRVIVRGTTADDGTVRRVLVNGAEARSTADNFATWEITLEPEQIREHRLEARAEDTAGNVEPRPHFRPVGSE